MLEFKKENGLAVAVSPTGLKVIAFGNGCQCGTANFLPITQTDTVAINTTLQDCDINGNPVDSIRFGAEYTVRIPVSELAGIPIWSEDGFSAEVIEIYIDKLVEMTKPVVEAV